MAISFFSGSPRSDPWVSLFADQMDFQFKNDKSANEFIEDVHPHPGDGGLAAQLRSLDARTYSIIAFLPNPNAHGSVLILSGLDIVGTQAAGRLITDLPRMGAILHTCGVGENGASPYFELLFIRKSSPALQPTFRSPPAIRFHRGLIPHARAFSLEVHPQKLP